VDKGSRQNRSVTSGKGLALRVGPRGLGNEGVTCGLWLRIFTEARLGTLASRGPEDALYLYLAFPSAWNNQLRTGADKGNPTV
jgi:hypothetical protein